MAAIGLRERSRLRRHAAIQRAALQLFAERGYDGATIADVAAAADVAPRTVLLYFPSKLDLAISPSNEAAERLTAAFASRAVGDTALDVFERWLRHEVEFSADVLALQRAMLEVNPRLRGAQSAAIEGAQRTAAASVATDLGRASDDVVVGLVTGAIGGVTSAVLTLDPSRTDVVAAVDTAMQLLRAAVAGLRSARR